MLVCIHRFKLFGCHALQIVRRSVRPLPGGEYLDGGLLPLGGLGLCGGQPVNEIIDGGQPGVLVQIEVCLYNFDFQIRAAALPNKPIQAERVRLDKHRFRSVQKPFLTDGKLLAHQLDKGKFLLWLCEAIVFDVIDYVTVCSEFCAKGGLRQMQMILTKHLYSVV